MMNGQTLEQLSVKYQIEISKAHHPALYKTHTPSCQLLSQVPVYSQRHPNLCGFHAVHNLISFDLHNTDSLLEQKRFLDNYHKSRNFLTSHIIPQSQRQSILQFNPFERLYLETILLKQSQFPQLKSKEIVQLMFGFNYIQNEAHQLQRLVSKIQEVKENKIEQLYVILGITTHWTLLVIRSNPLKLYYLDSMNYPLGRIMEGDFPLQQQSKESLNNEDENEKRLLKSYFKDLKKSIEIVLDLLLTDKSITTIKFQGQLQQMLDSFDKYSQSKQQVWEWIQEEYTVPVIWNDVLSMIPEISMKTVNAGLIDRFSEWMQVMTKYQILDLQCLQPHLTK